MRRNQYPLTHHPLARISLAALFVVSLSSCGKESGESANAPTWAEAPASAPASAEPTPSASNIASLAGRVCTGFFTQKLANSQEWVVGRPAVDSNGYPQDVVASKANIVITPRTAEAGKITWYSLEGEKLAGIQDADCKTATLYPRQLTQPNESKTWVASTKENATIPKFWDADALNPSQFAGAGLDYGEMPQANLAEILEQAAK